MIGNGPRNGFRVAPSSVDVIRKTVENLNKLLEIDNDVKKLDIGIFLDELTEYGITYDILDADEMPHAGVEACCNPQTLEICIRNDVYIDACFNDPRARFTVLHEFGHLILGHQRTINRETPNLELKTYEDSEWQADQFAAEFLMPYQVIKELNLNSVNLIMTHFNVSQPAAYRRINQLSKRGEI